MDKKQQPPHPQAEEEQDEFITADGKSEQGPKKEKMIEEVSRKELEKQLNAAEAKANDYWDKLLRTQAELENARRRFEKDITGAHKFGTEKLIAEILPVIDGIEKGLSIVPQHDEAKKIHEGLEMTQNLILKALEKFGVKVINPMGEVFNPSWHQALSAKEDAKAKHNTVIEVLQKGYSLHDRLLRPALVVIAK